MRPGPKFTVATPKNIAKFKRFIKADQRRTIRTLAKLTKLKFGTVRNILKKKLKTTNLGSISVPHKLTESEKIARKEWCDLMIELFEENVNGLINRILRRFSRTTTSLFGHSSKWIKVWNLYRRKTCDGR